LPLDINFQQPHLFNLDLLIPSRHITVKLNELYSCLQIKANKQKAGFPQMGREEIALKHSDGLKSLTGGGSKHKMSESTG